MAEPVVIKPISPQVVNELAALAPFDLKNHIQSPGETVTFSAGLSTGAALPKGLVLTSDGLLTGIPAKGTEGSYDVVVTATTPTGSITTEFALTIKQSLAQTVESIDAIKSQVWDALNQALPIDGIEAILNLPITKLDIYYLLERWGTLTVWDAFNLDPPSEKKLLKLEGVSEHYLVYDRGSSLIMAPKELFSHERTLQDGVNSSRALAREIFQRGWTIEMAGLDKYTHAAWVEFQHLGDKHGKRIEIINYTPSPEELRAYQTEQLMGNVNVPE